ncbi:monofunctional biosynthetic peptidoglycan transglycosylase [Melioribacter roseus P3M-2]|uniref:Biosynthetic peptidoglycan transglycosylase n=1 Tax=Melioribacter roseus (strain DSM 23840 / JCM 17771 / VKM B-2668 / P3M-2) TaxID=1191523 RepID=I6YZP3_MELRP|nr:monofunctional biosynthetic peptidoglycan transglycosylase [Melioribacter roseus]AFN76037.1 monofunctional biosynthetic peptidoglycan transglycosylase [Melioribacter roseus P3M-2]
MKIIKFMLKLIGLFTALNLLIILFFRFINPASTAFINYDLGLGSFFKTNYSENYSPVSLCNISRYMQLSVVASEDQRFFDHWGFDIAQIQKAIKENKKRKIARGASTITMQVAKNLFLWRSKSLIRKGMEVYYTILIELLWSKERILEVYLNSAELGDRIYGVKAAASRYFRLNPKKLNAKQSALLAATLPSPKKRNPSRATPYLIRRQGEIIRQMNLLGGLEFIKRKVNCSSVF